jgi:hypothetical protein
MMLAALNEDHIALLLEHEEVFDALFDMAASEGFRDVFGDSLLSEVIARYESELMDAADDSGPALRERYQRMKAEMETADPAEMLKKLRESAAFWDEELKDSPYAG